MQLRDVALRQGDDPHAGELHPLEQARNVLLVTAEPVYGLRQDHVEAAAACVLDQLVDARAQERGTGDRPVGVAVRDRPALALGVQPAEPQLILDGGVALGLGRVAGVKGDSGHQAPTSGLGRTRLLLEVVMVRLCGLPRQQPDDRS